MLYCRGGSLLFGEMRGVRKGVIEKHRSRAVKDMRQPDNLGCSRRKITTPWAPAPKQDIRSSSLSPELKSDNRSPILS